MNSDRYWWKVRVPRNGGCCSASPLPTPWTSIWERCAPGYWKSPTEALFLNRYGKRLSRRSIEKLVKGYAARAGLRDGVHTHTLRHTFASHMLEGQADLRVIQELLGHSSPTTTQIYTHITKQEARAAYLNFHPRAARE